MKNAKITIWAIAVALANYWLGLPIATAVVVFNDGATHTINYTIGDFVEVRNNFWDEATSVNLLSGGWVVDEVLAYQDSVISIFGGQIGDALFSGSNLYAYDTSQVNFSGGEIVRFLIAEDYSSVNFSGGKVKMSMYGYVKFRTFRKCKDR